jgi:hypothetical protein
MKAHEERLYKAFHNTPDALRNHIHTAAKDLLKRRHENVLRRFEQQQASRKVSEPVLRKIFHEAHELTLPAPTKLPHVNPPIEIPRPEKSWLKHGSVFIIEKPPFDDFSSHGTVSGGGHTNPGVNNNFGALQVSLDVGNPLNSGPNAGDGGTASCVSLVGMAYSPPGLACGQNVASGFMTASTNVSFSCAWEAGSKLYASGIINFGIGMQVFLQDANGNFLPILENIVMKVTENEQDFLRTTGDQLGGSQSLSAMCNVTNVNSYLITVFAVADASAWGGFGNPGFAESFAQGNMQVDVPFIKMDINYPSD